MIARIFFSTKRNETRAFVTIGKTCFDLFRKNNSRRSYTHQTCFFFSVSLSPLSCCQSVEHRRKIICCCCCCFFFFSSFCVFVFFFCSAQRAARGKPSRVVHRPWIDSFSFSCLFSVRRGCARDDRGLCRARSLVCSADANHVGQLRNKMAKTALFLI